mmetsp:Transcript_11540/g.12679  ORF Transcript_11540/g.12679 Transcript_11540/m.12679 type:complete len:300 (-) Transcript_11540:270-1169(-)
MEGDEDDDVLLPRESNSPKPLRFAEDDSTKSDKKRKVDSPTLIRKAQNKQQHNNNKKSRLNHLKGAKYEKFKSQSTATMFVDNTINKPDIQQVIECMATALDIAVRAGAKDGEKATCPEIFSERVHPLDAGVDLNNPPMKLYIEIFLGVVFKAAQLSGECGVMCMAYIDRLLKVQDLALRPSNWRRIVLGALMMASKVWEDQAVWNVDFITDETFPNLDVNDLNALEREYLNFIQYDVNLKAGEYAKYYFELKALLPPHHNTLLLQPLSKEETDKLEKRSHSVTDAEVRAKTKNLRETL